MFARRHPVQSKGFMVAAALGAFLFLAPATVHAMVVVLQDDTQVGWNVERSVDTMTDEEVIDAVSWNTEGFEFRISRDPKSPRVYGTFRLPQSSLDSIDPTKLAIYRVDEHEADDLADRLDIQEITGVVMVASGPHWIRFLVWAGEDEAPGPGALRNIMEGETIRFRYYLSTSGFRETTFPLDGANGAIAEVLGVAPVVTEVVRREPPLESATTDAQQPNSREGFWIGFGFGAGSLGFGGDVSEIDRETGLSGYLRMGGTLSQNVLLGVESNGWVGTLSEFTPEVDVTVGSLAGVVIFYPSSTGSFYLKGGLGWLNLNLEAQGFEGSSGSGFALSLGLGNEFRVGNNFSVVLFLNSIASSGVTLDGIDFDPNFVQLGVGVGWH